MAAGNRKLHRRMALLLAAGALVVANGVDAQELNLFEPVASVETARPAPSPAAPEASSGEPRFTLVGTSRFGDNYRVHLRSQSGDTVTVSTDAQGTAAIPGHAGYSISGVGSRDVAINHPGNAPCVAAPDKGVSCVSGSTSRLQIATAAPIQVQEPEPVQRRRRGAEQREAEDNGNGADEPINPFAAALRAARERSPEDEAVMRAQVERFERRRIDPADVPEGARVVRTPFGDRVVRTRDQQ